MYKSIIVLLGLALCVGSLKAQQSSIDELLQTVEANNKSLAAYRSYMKSEILQFKSQNKLPDLQASAYYLPFGTHTPGDYSEFEISQRVEFPTVYAARSTWIDEQQKRLEYKYLELRQDIMLKAKKLGLEFIYLQKLRELIEDRLTQSQKVYDQMQTLFDKGQSGILDLNKAKIVWLDQQFALKELTTLEVNVMHELESMNGGNEIKLQLTNYPNAIEIPAFDSLWNDRMNQDAQIALLEQEKQVAEQQLKVERNQLLPDITAGFNYQGVSGSNYSGIFAGISIPLWKGRSQVNAAEAQIDFHDRHQSDVINSLKSEYSSKVQHYQLLLEKFREYQKALGGLNSEMLLRKAYELGEISFMDYYREVSFYREAENRMLEIEKNLQQLRAELFNYVLSVVSGYKSKRFSWL